MRRRPKDPPRGTLGEYAESPRSDLRAAAEQLRGFGGGALCQSTPPPPPQPSLHRLTCRHAAQTGLLQRFRGGCPRHFPLFDFLILAGLAICSPFCRRFPRRQMHHTKFRRKKNELNMNFGKEPPTGEKLARWLKIGVVARSMSRKH